LEAESHLSGGVTCSCGYLLRVDRQRLQLLQRNPGQEPTLHPVVVRVQFLQNADDVCRMLVLPAERRRTDAETTIITHVKLNGVSSHHGQLTRLCRRVVESPAVLSAHVVLQREQAQLCALSSLETVAIFPHPTTRTAKKMKEICHQTAEIHRNKHPDPTLAETKRKNWAAGVNWCD